jgi:hypothetical protein
LVSALLSIAAAEWSKNQHLRDFWCRSIFDFFDSIDPQRTSAGFTQITRTDAYELPRVLSGVGVGQKVKAMSAEINIYNPEELGPPMGQYTHVTRVRANEFLFIAGMLSGDAAGNVIGEGEFDIQTVQVFRYIEPRAD